MGPTEGRASLFAKNKFFYSPSGKYLKKYEPKIMRPAGFGKINSAGRRDSENDFGRPAGLGFGQKQRSVSQMKDQVMTMKAHTESSKSELSSGTFAHVKVCARLPRKTSAQGLHKTFHARPRPVYFFHDILYKKVSKRQWFDRRSDFEVCIKRLFRPICAHVRVCTAPLNMSKPRWTIIYGGEKLIQ